MTANRQIRQTIVQLLSNMSDGKEIRSYLNRFSEVDQSRFAVIKIGGAVLHEDIEDTAAALAFLHTVGLTPIVLHGGGPQLDAALSGRNVETPKIDGLRVTDAEALDVAREVFVDVNIRLVEAVREQGVSAHSLTAGVIEADYLDREKYGFVGAPRHIRLDQIQSVASSGAIPILTCLGVAPGGQILNINGDTATRALVAALKPIKIVFLSSVGGLLDASGAPISSINLAEDLEKLLDADWVHSGMRLKLQEIARLLDEAPPSSSVSITTPQELVKELFTHGGAGTLVRRGEAIRVESDKASVDGARLGALVENAFGARLTPGWWDAIALHQAVVSANYRAGAVLVRLGDVVYLDKFAVVEDARGEGLSRTIWRRMIRDNPLVYWRSRTTNGFNAFYNEVASGFVRRGPWTVYWAGEANMDSLKETVARIAALPATLEEQPCPNPS